MVQVGLPAAKGPTFYEQLASEHGVVCLSTYNKETNAVDIPKVLAVQTPAAGGGLLKRVLSMVPEGDAEESGADSDDSDRQATEGSSTHKKTPNDGLAACGATGLLPRPDASVHAIDMGSGHRLTAIHMDQVPFTLRQATPTDAGAIHQLQAYVTPNLLHRRTSFHKMVKQLEALGRGRHCWVAEVGGQVAAAVLLQPAEGALGCLAFQLVAVHPALEERAEVLCALIYFVIEHLINNSAVHELCQGNLRLAPGGPDVPVCTFKTTGEKLGIVPEDDATVSSLPIAGSIVKETTTFLRREVAFCGPLSLDSLIASSVGATAALAVPLPEAASMVASASVISLQGGVSGPTRGVSIASERTDGTSTSGLRSKATSIADEVRRLTQQLNLDATGADVAAEETLSAIMEVVKCYLESSDMDPPTFTSATPLGDAGLDSLDMLKLAGLLSDALDTALPSTVLFDYPTVDALCTYVVVAQGISNALHAATEHAAQGGPSRRRSSSIMFSVQGGGAPGTGRRVRTSSFGRPSEMMLPRMQRTTRTGSFGRSTMGAFSASPSPSGVKMLSIPGTLSTAARNRPSLFLHGELAASVPLDRRRGTMYDSTRPLSTLQVVVADATSVRFPGTAAASGRDLFSCTGADAIQTVPPARWDIESGSSRTGGRPAARFGAFVGGVSQFDSTSFGLSTSEAILMDPQQRLLLECTFEAANSSPAGVGAALSPQQAAARTKSPSSAQQAVGVFVGASYTEYLHLGTAADGPSGYTASGGSLSVLAGRLAYVFGFTGPAVLTDTACSSSLVALGAAHNALRLGQSQSAVAGAVNLMLVPQTTAMYLSAGMLTPDGRCKTLDIAADGYVRSEAAAATTLRMLTSAAAGAQGKSEAFVAILAAVVNQDGRSSSLTAPNGPAQTALIRSALQAAHATAAHVSFLQKHGTGTALGDPIEINAALTVLCAKRSDAGALGLSASKATFGHAEPAAGAIGLAAAVLCLESKATAQQLHLRVVNPYVSQCFDTFAKSVGKPAVAAARTVAPMPSTQPASRAVASVSGFAFQGTNAHTVVEYIDPGTAGGPSLFTSLSAEPLPWQRSRLWVAPEGHALLSKAVPKLLRSPGRPIIFEANLGSAWGAEVMLGGGGLQPAAAVGWSVAAEVRHGLERHGCLRGFYAA